MKFKGTCRRGMALICSILMLTQMGMAGAAESEAQSTAAYPDYYSEHTIRALEQGDELDDPYMHRDELFTTNMVHNNPALEPYTSNYNDSEFLAQRNFDGQVFFLYDCAQYGLLWDEFDAAKGAIGENKVFPEGSAARTWVEAKRAELHKKYGAADAAGIKIYFMMDMIVLPTHLKTLYPEVLTNNKINIEKSETQEVMDYMFQEMFTEFPEIDGIYVRYGETYTGAQYGAPYHTGNNPILNGEQTHMALIRYLGDKLYGERMVDDKPRDVIYRTWGFGGFQNNPKDYLAVSEKVPTNDHLYFCVKHSTGDFHRNVAFNQTIGIGAHQQIVEVQAAREYEGKGAYPNYIIDGVINGFEEYEWLVNDKTQNMSLRDVINTEEHPQVKGIWTWARGGGWNGPYINGVNGIVGDTTSDNREVVIQDGSELWDDLNTYVVTQWAKDTSKTDKYYVKQYAETYLGMDEEDAENFYRLCILSARAVLLGRATDIPNLGVNTWWTRDQNISPSALEGNISNAVNKGLAEEMLAEKAECTALWEEMIGIARGFQTDAVLIDSPLRVKDHIITTCRYGYYFFAITEQMNIAGVAKKTGEKTGNYDIPAMIGALNTYDRLWQEWQTMYETVPGCPSLFAKENKSLSLVGYGGNTGLDGFMDSYRESLSLDSMMQVSVEGVAALPIQYSYGSDTGNFTFVSSDPDVAYVNEAGQVVGVAVGKCRITVQSNYSDLAAAIMVEVVEGPIAGAEYETVWSNSFDTADSINGFAQNTPTWDNGTAVMAGSGKNFILPVGKHTGELRFSGDFKISAVENDHFALRDNNDKTLLQVDFRPNTPIFALNYGSDGLPQIGDGEYSLNTYYHMEITMDTTAQRFDIVITEEGTGKTFALEDQRFREAAADFSNIRFGVRGGGSMVMDDLKLERLVNGADVRFKEDFSENTAEQWKGTGTAAWNENDQTMEITGTSNPDLYLPLGDNFTGILTASWKMKVDRTNARAFVRLSDENGKHLGQVEFRGGTGGNTHIIVDNSNLVDVTAAAYEADTWYPVVVAIDTYGKTYTVTIGEDAKSFTSFKDGGNTGLGRIDAGTRDAAKLTIDDIRITATERLSCTAADIAATITSLPAVPAGAEAIRLPAVPDGFTVSVDSSDPDIIDADGTIHYPGEETEVAAVLNVTNQKDAGDTAKTARLAVMIPAFAHVTGVSVRPETVHLYSNSGEKTVQLTATVEPAAATNQGVVWSSGNEEVATVDASTGLVTITGTNGAAIITATTRDGGHTATCTVTVSTYTSSSSGSNTKTETKKNEDGSTTKTVTNKTTGTVTETTTWPNGDKTVVVTKKDGTRTETVTKKDGAKSETATNSDGSMTRSETTAEGVKTKTVITAEGETTAEITLPKQVDEAVVTIPAEKPTASTVAVIVKEDGTEELAKTSIATEDGVKLTVTGNVKVKLIDNSKEFTDVAKDHWASEAVSFVTSRELFNGTGEGVFDPDTTTSRAMLFTVLARLEGVDTAGGETWYSKAMDWAKSSGISDGTNPDGTITREQLATMLYRYAGEPKAEEETEVKTFTDSENISDWAKEAMDWAVKAGILNGKDGDRLDPTGTASRAEVAIMLQRFVVNQ